MRTQFTHSSQPLPPPTAVLLRLGLWLFVLGLAITNVQADGVVVGSLSRSLPEVDPGTVLLGELNCTACHSANSQITSHLLPRPSPRLGTKGLALTPQGIRAFLTDPQKEKPGTPMPDLLHGVSDRPGDIDALVHFLSSIQPNLEERPEGANDFTLQRGKLLYHQLGCIACHAPQELVQTLRASDGESSATHAIDPLPALKARSIPLGNLARKTTVAALTGFLTDPLNARPSGRMPSFNLDQAEATAIAVYLLRQQAGLANPDRPAVRIAGLEYQYFEQPFGSATQLDQSTPAASGVTPQFKTTPRKRDQQFGLRFTGSIAIANPGEYTFYSHSDDGSIVWINGTMVVNNDGDHGGSEKSGKIRLPAGQHAIRVAYYNNGGPFELRVSFEGPKVRKQEIPAVVLSHFGQPMVPLDREELVLDPSKVARGRALFGSLGCAACHESDGVALTPVEAKPLHQVDPNKPGGCLNIPKTGRPKYELNTAQTEALKQTLAARFRVPPSASQRISHTMAALNCFACHSRHGAGGPEPTRAEYFTSLKDVDLGDEGRIPPHLTGVGEKLRTDWFHQVLQGRDKVRPYMASRMPHFGDRNVSGLPALFAEADLPTPATTTDSSLADPKMGRKLAGTTGLSCIACHTFDQYASLGVPAMDLTLMSKRLRPEWFRRYLLDPPGLRPGTRMPNFWPDGESANQDILNGNPEAQIQSLWAFLEKGAAGGLPPGLIQGQQELAPNEEALIYRHFITGAGSRAIGVGYPEKANLAFDANDIRLALIWQGAFIDAAKHRSGRGSGSEQPLGYNVIRMTPGAAFAKLSDPDAPWPSPTGREAGYKMRGYRLDPERRPAFLYSLNDIQIEDYPVDKPGELDGVFQRTLTLRSDSPPNNLWFRAWIGQEIETAANNAFRVDGALTIKFGPDTEPRVRRTGDRSELLVPVRFVNGTATLTEELLW